MTRGRARADVALSERHVAAGSDEERLARVEHAPKCEGCKARASHALVSAWPGRRTPGACGSRAKHVAARSACTSRASKRVAWEE
jgi:hypothetical protein